MKCLLPIRLVLPLLSALCLLLPSCVAHEPYYVTQETDSFLAVEFNSRAITPKEAVDRATAHARDLGKIAVPLRVIPNGQYIGLTFALTDKTGARAMLGMRQPRLRSAPWPVSAPSSTAPAVRHSVLEDDDNLRSRAEANLQDRSLMPAR